MKRIVSGIDEFRGKAEKDGRWVKDGV